MRNSCLISLNPAVETGALRNETASVSFVCLFVCRLKRCDFHHRSPICSPLPQPPPVKFTLAEAAYLLVTSINSPYLTVKKGAISVDFVRPSVCLSVRRARSREWHGNRCLTPLPPRKIYSCPRPQPVPAPFAAFCPHPRPVTARVVPIPTPLPYFLSPSLPRYRRVVQTSTPNS